MKRRFYWLNDNLAVSKTETQGYGTFSKRRVKKGELLDDNGIQITGSLSLCVVKNGVSLAGINFVHHSNPDAGIKGHIFLVAMRDIEKGEEVHSTTL